MLRCSTIVSGKSKKFATLQAAQSKTEHRYHLPWSMEFATHLNPILDHINMHVALLKSCSKVLFLLCSTEWFGDVGLETQWWMDKERKWRAGAWRGPVPPPGLPAQLAQLIPAFCWWGKSATPHCTVQSRESSLLVSEWVSQCAHYASVHVSHADFAFVYPSVCVCVCVCVWAVSSLLDWSPTVLSVSNTWTTYEKKKSLKPLTVMS